MKRIIFLLILVNVFFSCAKYKSSEDCEVAPTKKINASTVDWSGSRTTEFNDVKTNDDFEESNSNKSDSGANNIKIK